MKEKAIKSSLAVSSGSRILAWRFMLNLIPLERNYKKWISAVKDQRERFKKITQKYSLKSTRKLDPNIFNPLAPQTKEAQMLLNNDLRDIINKDVVRTF